MVAVAKELWLSWYQMNRTLMLFLLKMKCDHLLYVKLIHQMMLKSFTCFRSRCNSACDLLHHNQIVSMRHSYEQQEQYNCCCFEELGLSGSGRDTEIFSV